MLGVARLMIGIEPSAAQIGGSRAQAADYSGH
jgi:hypothetical protein